MRIIIWRYVSSWWKKEGLGVCRVNAGVIKLCFILYYMENAQKKTVQLLENTLTRCNMSQL